MVQSALRSIQYGGGRLAMDALSVPALFAVEDGVLVLGQHFLLPRHLVVPALNSFRGHHTITLKCGADGVDDLVNEPQSFPLAGFLRGGESPWSFPVTRELG